MRVGVLGTGGVGQTLATKLVELGHDVTMGARSAGNEKAAEWAAGAGERAAEGSFADAAAHGELVLNCTAGTASLDALRAAGAEELRGKVLVDVANPLDFSKGMPPTLSVCNDDSLGEQIQREFPDARVVKALNTVSAMVMVAPIDGTILPICGDDAGAKEQVASLLGDFGWPAESIVDLGGIEQARGTEMYLALWIRLMGATGTPQFNIAVVRG
jgi:8-hydroxy-5-deazaflavin:NADPH oxidoreductase